MNIFRIVFFKIAKLTMDRFTRQGKFYLYRTGLKNFFLNASVLYHHFWAPSISLAKVECVILPKRRGIFYTLKVNQQ